MRKSEKKLDADEEEEEDTDLFYLRILKEIPVGRSVWLKYRRENGTTFLRLDRSGGGRYKLHGVKSKTVYGSAEEINRIIHLSPFLSKAVVVRIDECSGEEEDGR